MYLPNHFQNEPGADSQRLVFWNLKGLNYWGKPSLLLICAMWVSASVPTSGRSKILHGRKKSPRGKFYCNKNTQAAWWAGCFAPTAWSKKQLRFWEACLENGSSLRAKTVLAPKSLWGGQAQRGKELEVGGQWSYYWTHCLSAQFGMCVLLTMVLKCRKCILHNNLESF